MERLINGLKENQIPFTMEQIDTLEKYMDEILQLNNHINLTAITDKEEFVEKHYMDSLAICKYMEMQNAHRILDLGTGAGFPGIPLAVIYPDKEFVLVDSLNKRLKIIDSLCEKLSIHNVKTCHGRAEELARKPEFRDGFDLCVSRAVANLPVLCEYCLPFVKVGGTFVAYKGPEVHEEMEKARKAIKLLCGKFNKIEQAKLGNTQLEHNLVFIDKAKATDKKYPRKPGTPSKEPLI